MELSKYIDHTNLNNSATLKDIEKLCNEAIEYNFASVCIYPYYVPLASKLLKDTNIEVCTVIGFPSGESTKETKAFEAINAIENGATEIDMVINISALKNKDYDYVKEEIEEIRDSIDGHTLKVIIETNLLSEKEIIKMTEICNDTYVNFIKTCTGFNGGVKLEDVKTIMEHKNDLLEVKASGGIKNHHEMMELIDLGVTRIGSSHGTELLECDCKEEK